MTRARAPGVSPSSASSSVDFPEPLAPKITATRSLHAAWMLSEKLPRSSSTPICTACPLTARPALRCAACRSKHSTRFPLAARFACGLLAEPALGDQHRGEREREGGGAQRERGAVVAELDAGVDAERERLRAPRQDAGDERRGAELAERAREGEEHAVQHAAPRERQRHAQEGLQRREAERAREPLVARIDRGEGLLARAREQREADDAGRDRGRPPGEDELDPERRPERAERTAPAEQQQQREADRDRRQHHRQRDQRLHQRLAAEGAAREQEAQRDRGQQDRGGRDQRRPAA